MITVEKKSFLVERRVVNHGCLLLRQYVTYIDNSL